VNSIFNLCVQSSGLCSALSYVGSAFELMKI
jgi:hypothetical protein